LPARSGYSFKEWKGTFYPESIKPDAMLAWYAERLPSVEINNTFYQMPKVAVLENWGEEHSGALPVCDQGFAPHHPYGAAQSGGGSRFGRFSLPEPGGTRRQARPGGFSSCRRS